MLESSSNWKLKNEHFKRLKMPNPFQKMTVVDAKIHNRTMLIVLNVASSDLFAVLAFPDFLRSIPPRSASASGKDGKVAPVNELGETICEVLDINSREVASSFFITSPVLCLVHIYNESRILITAFHKRKFTVIPKVKMLSTPLQTTLRDIGNEKSRLLVSQLPNRKFMMVLATNAKLSQTYLLAHYKLIF